MATKFFQSPSNTPPQSNGDRNFLVAQEGMGGDEFLLKNDIRCTSTFFSNQKFLVAIQRTPTVRW
jgi:hypothetical protein